MSHLLLAILLLLTLAGCAGARRGSPFDEPFEPADARLREGEAVFMRYCNPCHPGGEAGLGPALNNKPLPIFLMKAQVRHGLGVMPSFPDSVISDEQLGALTAYLVGLRHHD